MKRITKQKGETHSNSRLKEYQVIAIYQSKESTGDLARKYDVNWTTIDSIKRQKTWRHLWNK